MLLLSESLQRSSLLLTRLSSAQSRTRGRGRGIQLRAVAGMTGPPAGVAEGAAAAAVAAPTANPTLHHSEVLLATSEPFDGWRFPMCTSQTNMIVRYPMPCPARAAAFASRDSWAAYLRAAGLRLRVHPEDTMAAAAAAPPDAAGNPPAAAATYADLSGVEFAICWNPPSGLLARVRCSVLRSALCLPGRPLGCYRSPPPPSPLGSPVLDALRYPASPALPAVPQPQGGAVDGGGRGQHDGQRRKRRWQQWRRCRRLGSRPGDPCAKTTCDRSARRWLNCTTITESRPKFSSLSSERIESGASLMMSPRE